MPKGSFFTGVVVSSPQRLHRNRSKGCYYPPTADRPTMPLSSLGSMRDSDVMRGAALIRKQIQQKLNEEDQQQQQQQYEQEQQQQYGLVTTASTQEPEDLYDFSFENGEPGLSMQSKSNLGAFHEDDDDEEEYTFEQRVNTEIDKELAYVTTMASQTSSNKHGGKVSPVQRDDKEPVRGENSSTGKRHAQEGAPGSDTASHSTASSTPPPPPPPDEGDHTPISYMGRGNNLRMKTHTYIVELFEVEDHDSRGDSYDFVEDDYIDDGLEEHILSHQSPPVTKKYNDRDRSPLPETVSDQDYSNPPSPELIALPRKVLSTPRARPMPEKVTHVSNTKSHSPPQVTAKSTSSLSTDNSSSTLSYQTPTRSLQTPTRSHHFPTLSRQVAVFTPSPTSRYLTTAPMYIGVVPTLSKTHDKLLMDKAYLHAQNAGTLWQSLVGQQLRFPTQWWNGMRAAPLGCENASRQKWEYLGRHPIRDEVNLKHLVKNRSSAGRILLHVIVQDTSTFEPVMDIAVGAFHPNARGVRRTEEADLYEEDCRDLWLAVRQRIVRYPHSVGILEPFLSLGQVWSQIASKGPLGPKQRVTNVNVRSVFGESPPLETVIQSEHFLYDCLSDTEQSNPPMTLLHEFNILQ